MQRRRTKRASQSSSQDEPRASPSEARTIRTIRKSMVAMDPRHHAEYMTDSPTELMEHAASNGWAAGIEQMLAEAPGVLRRHRNTLYLTGVAAARKRHTGIAATVMCAWTPEDGDLGKAVTSCIEAIAGNIGGPTGIQTAATELLHHAVVDTTHDTAPHRPAINDVARACISAGAEVSDGMAAHANHIGNVQLAADLVAALPSSQAAGEIIEDWVIVPDDERTGKTAPGTRIRNWIAAAEDRPALRPAVATAAMAVPQDEAVWSNSTWRPDGERPDDTAVAGAAMDTFRRSSTLAAASNAAFDIVAQAGQRLLSIIAGLATTGYKATTSGIRATKIVGRRASRLMVNRDRTPPR